MQFLFCMEEDSSMPSDEHEFGDGFALAGCTFIHLLNQTDRFNLLDFSYHLLNVKMYENDSSKDEIPEADRPQGAQQNFVGNVGQEMEAAAKAFIKQAGQLRRLNSSNFALLRCALPQKCRDDLVFHRKQYSFSFVSDN